MADKKGRGFVEQRRQTILTILREKGRVSVAELSERLGISTLTVRRDLDELEARGLATRRYGEALLAENAMSLEQMTVMSPFERTKDAIARAAAEMVSDHELLFINTSSTALMVAKHVAAYGVTIVTNSLHGQELEAPEGGMVLVTGGEVRPPRGVLSGEFALANIRSVAASTCFVGCAGISLTAGITSTTQQESIVNSLMVGRSDRMVLLADSRKLGISAGFSYADLSQVNLLITDQGATDEDVQVLLEAGIHEIRRV
ncbi:DeoR/GlpR family DNA-binding transcription regulator [Paratractidigestivibacter sp.]|uniref:DeoR/GlpR family DNA-binding transcription regulator n=1 Tax=Paratractidigestivibacter sp. TaxID=2847316 RepID=UPI002ABDAC28|nr:DeoR/GlpR family DNA-binding transcription regulator [Paratractidigestivibacter sp.]